MRNLLFRILLEVTKYVLKISLYLNLPLLTSIIFFINLRKVKTQINFKKKINIIVLEKSHGIEDIKKLIEFKLDKDLNFFLLSRILMFIIYDFFKKKTHAEYIDYINKVFEYLKRFIKLNLIISFNIRYDGEKVLQKLDKKLNIKFLVCQKECLFNKIQIQEYEKYLKNEDQFQGDIITVYNSIFKEMLVRSNYVDENKVKVIGMPRADYFYNNKSFKKKEYVLFLLIRPTTGLLFLKNDFNWNEMGMITLREVLKFAEKNRHIQFIFKTKTVNDHETLDQQNLIKQKNLENCKIFNGGDTQNLILNSKFIITFNSTAIFEGISSKKKIIIPFFKKKYEKYLRDFIVDTSGSKNIFHAEDLNHLNNLLHDLSFNEEKLNYVDSARDNELLKINIGNFDGKSSERLTKVIENLI